MRSAVAGLVAILAMPVFGARVTGKVMYENGALPGCTVTLDTHEVISDADGAYAFDDVERGHYTLTMRLDGFQSVSSDVVVRGESVQVPVQELSALVTDVDFVVCKPCNEDPPETPWGYPACTDYDYDATLIDAVQQGDSSALEMLRQRYDNAFTYAEKQNIAPIILGRVHRDQAMWDELYAQAEIAVRFPEPREEAVPEFAAWCEARGVDPEQAWDTGLRALGAVGADPRSHALLMQGLENSDQYVVMTAIWSLGRQHDDAALPAIERALIRLPEYRDALLTALNEWESDAGKALANQYASTEAEPQQ